MTIEEIDKLTSLFKETFPYYDKNPNIVIDDEKIKEGLLKAEKHINKRCRTLRDKILVYLAMHIILKESLDEEAFKDSQFEELDKVDSFEVGDISVDVKGDDKGKEPPSWWGDTKYGIRAWELSLVCASSRVGIIV